LGSNNWFPFDDPYITVVGGTDLTTASAGGAWASETGWEDSGGGYSWETTPYAIPTWQTSYINFSTCTSCSTTLRNGPDVGGNSNWTFYTCGDQTTCLANCYGGTSFATPMWAAYYALINQAYIADGNTKGVGFLNPLIYPLAAGSSYSSYFHDITSGSNGYSATPGFDLVTGWGSMNGSTLITTIGSGAKSTTTVLTSSSNPSETGKSVTFTATVTPSPGTVGTMAFTAAGKAISGCTAVALSGGVATCSTAKLAQGTTAIVATYAGGTGYLGSTSNTLSEVVTFTQLVTNGGFESGMTGWTVTTGGCSPAIATAQKHSGTYSLAMGAYVHSTCAKGEVAAYQTVTIPANANTATLTVWYYPETNNTSTANDFYAIAIKNTSGTTLTNCLIVASNSKTWTEKQCNMAAYKGESVEIFTAVSNNGSTTMGVYEDDISLVIN
jgi:hypothetical protein